MKLPPSTIEKLLETAESFPEGLCYPCIARISGMELTPKDDWFDGLPFHASASGSCGCCNQATVVHWFGTDYEIFRRGMWKLMNARLKQCLTRSESKHFEAVTKPLLTKLRAGDWVCHDCLLKETGIEPFLGLVACNEKKIFYGIGPYECGHCGQPRQLVWGFAGEDQLIELGDKVEKYRETLVRQKPDNNNLPPTVTSQWLDDSRREIISILNRTEHAFANGEALSKRVSRLRDAHIVPGNIANLIQTVISFRNLAEYENYALHSDESFIVQTAMNGVRAWGAARAEQHGN